MVTHDICLRGAVLGRTGAETPGPTLLQRTDQEFLSAVLDQLRSGTGRQALARDVVQAGNDDGIARLFQPVHRTFHLVLLEALCERPGRPRLDPARIESAGLVVRRRRRGRTEGWLESGGRLLGWLPFGAEVGRDPTSDPDPDRRPARLAGETVAVRRNLTMVRPEMTPFSEQVAPLFVAPPDVCAEAGRTLLFGLVPVTSSERTDEVDVAERYTDEQVRAHLSPLLQTRSTRTRSSAEGYSFLGRTLRANDLASRGDHQMLQLCLEQLAIELDVFGSSGEPGVGSALRELLDQIALAYPGDRSRPAGELLQRAARVLLNRELASTTSFGEASNSVLMPESWPPIGRRLRRQIVTRAREALETRAAAVTPGEGRYANPGDAYQVEGFVRVRRDDGCPPHLVWTDDPSRPFTIVPWYESGAAPPVQVALPDATDRDLLRKLKPDIAFSVPENLFNTLRGTSLEKLMNGERGSNGRTGLDWLCGFNIPIITVCAFFVLSIFLGLLNFLFFWLPFVRICIPFPRREPSR